MAGIPSPPPLAPARRRAPERVSSSDGPWCCSVSTAIPTTSLADESAKKTQSHELLPQAQLRRLRGSRHRQNRGEGKSGNSRRTGRKNSTSGGGEEEIINKKSENSGDFVAKTGVEVTALIKQGFLEGGGSPFRIRVSPGRVSPIYESPSLTLITTDSSAKNNALLRHSSSTTSCNNNNNNNSSNNNNNNNNNNNTSVDKTRSSPTLFEMMVNEHSSYSPNPNPGSNGAPSLSPASAPLSSYPPKRHFLSVEEKLERILVSACSPGNQFNDAGSGDVRLTLSNKDGISVTLSLHRHVLASHSRIFASKLEEWPSGPLPCLIEISDCDDVEIYLQTLRLMYCRDLKRRLMNETVSRILGILTVSAAIVFEAGIHSCLEYLEAMPWPEEDEERVCLLLSQLELGSMGGGGEEVLKRLWSQEDPLRGEGGCGSEAVLVELLHSITTTRGTDEKARREMKAMVARMLRENNNNYSNYSRSQSLVDIRKESLYNSCQGCIDALLDLFKQASCPVFASSDERISIAKQISRQADNLNWLVDILVDREIAGDLIHTWGCQTEMAALHCHVPVMYRFEISYVTARLCLAIAKGQVVIRAGERFRLLDVWLKPLMDDFTWMQRCGNKDGVGLERKSIEEGISQTILTLPLMQQQAILLSWFNCFLSRGADDCPNLHHAFEVWWRRSFVRRPPHRLLSLPPIDTPLLPPSS